MILLMRGGEKLLPIAIDMKNITQGIEVAYSERAAFLSDLSKDTHETLKTFHRQHQRMATNLGNFLSSNRDDRQKAVASLRGKNKTELRVMADKLAGFLKQTTSAMKQGTAAMKQDTAELMNRIRQDISSMETEIASLLSGLEKDRLSMGREIKNELVSTTRGRIEQVKNMLGAFSAEHKAQSHKLRRRLASFQKQLETTVTDMRASFIKDLKESRQSWQNLARIMAAKRAGKAATPAKKIEGEVIEDVVSAVNLKVQMMRLISAATSGMSLSRMGKTLGVPYIRLAKPASELVKLGEIEKRDSKYFGV